MANKPTFEAWKYFTRIIVKDDGKSKIRLLLEIPMSFKPRAERFLCWLSIGRIEGATVIIEGSHLPEAMERLGFPQSCCDIATQITLLRGHSGIPTPQSDLDEKRRYINILKRQLKQYIDT